MTCKRALLGGVFPGVLATPTLAAQAAPSCEAWNTKEYFKAATLEDVTACLDAGTNLETQTKYGETPWDLAKANKALKGSDAYWRLNEERFEAPSRGKRGARTTGQAPASKADVPASGVGQGA